MPVPSLSVTKRARARSEKSSINSQDEQSLRDALIEHLGRSDFTVNKDQTSSPGKTMWTVTFSEPEAVDGYTAARTAILDAGATEMAETAAAIGQPAADAVFEVYSEASNGTFGLEVAFSDLNETALNISIDNIAFDATPGKIKEALQTAINDVLLTDDGRQIKAGYRLDVKPKVLVTGAGTAAFPWQITLANLGDATITAVASGVGPSLIVAANSASGITGKVTAQIKDVTGSSDRDRLYGIQRELETILSFELIGEPDTAPVADAPRIAGEQDVLEFSGQIQHLETGQPVLYEVNAGNETVNGLVSGKIYFVKAETGGTTTKVKFFLTGEDAMQDRNAILLSEPETQSIGATHTLKSVPSIHGGDGESRIVSTVTNDAGAIFGSGGADVLIGSNGADFIDGGEGDDVLFADGSHTGTRSIYRQSISFSAGVDAFIVVFGIQQKQIDVDDTDEAIINKLQQFDGIEAVYITRPDGVDAPWQIDYEGETSEIGDKHLVTPAPGVAISPRLIPDNADGVFGGDGKDIIVGYSGDDNLFGGDDDDELVGGAGSDIVRGGDGDDTISVIEAGKTTDYDIADGGEGSDTYEFKGSWGVASIKEEGSTGIFSGENYDAIDLSDLSENYTHILSNGSLFSTAGSLYNSEITFADGSTMKLGTVLEALEDSRASPGEIVTPWGFGFHQAASGADAKLMAHAAATSFGKFDFLLRVDRGDGAEIYDVSVNVPAVATIEEAKQALENALRVAIGPYGHGPLASAGLEVGIADNKLYIIAKANNTLVQGDDTPVVVPAQIELTVKAANTIVASGKDFERVDKIKLGDGSQTFVFGNDYWGGASSALSAAQAIPLVDVIARNLQGELTIDTRDLMDEKSVLELDFRAVNHELRFNFTPTGEDGIVRLTVSKVRDLTLPFFDQGPEIRDNEIIFTHVDENAVIYGGRYKNTFNFDAGATFKGKLIGGEGGAVGGALTFPGRTSDQLLALASLWEDVVTFNLTADRLSDAFFQVQNVLSYSNPGSGLSSSGAVGSINPLTYVNLQQLKVGDKTLTDGDKAWQVITGNLFGPAFDLAAKASGLTTTGFSGNTENTTDASLGDVIVRSGINLVRGTDYTPSLDAEGDSLAFFRSGADNISIGDNIASITPGVHILAGGSGPTLTACDRSCGAWR